MLTLLGCAKSLVGKTHNQLYKVASVRPSLNLDGPKNVYWLLDVLLGTDFASRITSALAMLQKNPCICFEKEPTGPKNRGTAAWYF